MSITEPQSAAAIMNYTAIFGAFLALAVVASGAAIAAPGNAPTDVPRNETAADQDVSDAADAGAENRAGPAVDADRGPPADLPDQVPDFVGDIHDLVRQHVSGSLDGILGHQVSDVTPDNETDAGQPAAALPAAAGR